MKILFLILNIFLTRITIGQQVLPDSGFTNKIEAKNLKVNGKKEGKWCEYVKGVLLSINESDITNDTNLAFSYRLIVYKGGKRNGIVRQYYMNGKLLGEKMYVNGKENGMEKWYYENRMLKSETHYNMDKENGTRKTYYENGSLESETPFTNGKINGVDKEYYENGKLKYEFPRANSENNGVLKEYYEDGKLKTESPYINDTVNGTVKNYYENGEVMAQTQFKKGKENGTKYFSNRGNEITLEQIKTGSSSFNWTDTILRPYSKKIVNMQYELDGPCTVAPCYEARDNHFIYDTLIAFLKAHTSIEIEIASYFNRGNNYISDDWSKLKANYMKQLLVEKGINADQIIAVGYGNRNPILSEQEIKKLPKSEQPHASFKNTRIEIIIIENGNTRL
jgi:antitoxin component YwqK of YwqJK toxin-antitoxin module